MKTKKSWGTWISQSRIIKRYQKRILQFVEDYESDMEEIARATRARVAKIPFPFKEERARADVWIDNAVYEIRKGDPAGVYRHATQENRKKAFLELDYIKVH